MNSRFNRLMTILIALVTIADLILMKIEQLTGVVKWFEALGAILLCVLLPYCYAGWRGLFRLANVCNCLIWALLGNATLTVLIVLAGRSSAPLVDRALANIDRALFISVGSIVQWTENSPALHTASWLVYPALTPLVLVPLFVLPFSGRQHEAQRYVLAITIAAIMTAAIFAFLPAVGPWTIFGFKPTPEQAGIQKYLAAVLKSNSPAPLLFGLSGIVSFPSFHVVMAVLSAMALWRVRYIGYLAGAIAGGICFSTVTTGWHYAIDVIGGIAVLLISHWLAVLALGRKPNVKPQVLPPISGKQ